MKLIVTRHAKSSWDFPNLSDHDRPLSKRGRRSCDLIGNWLVENGHIPETVLSSTSTRTRETWQRMSGYFSLPTDVRFEPDLYHGGPGAILDVLSTANQGCTLVLGHNPGMAYFASSILKSHPSHVDFLRYPTAATLVCDVPSDHWAQVEFGSGDLIDFVVPRELE